MLFWIMFVAVSLYLLVGVLYYELGSLSNVYFHRFVIVIVTPTEFSIVILLIACFGVVRCFNLFVI